MENLNIMQDKESALAMALALAIAAPSEEKAAECIAIAETIANSGMTLDQVLAAKARAQDIVGARP
jgi:hypothetical protein